MKNSDIVNLIVMFFLALVVLGWTYFIVDKKVNSIVRGEILNIEYEKVWWKDNFELMSKLTTDQLTQYRARYWDSIPDAGGQAWPSAWSWEPTMIDIEKAASLKEWAYIKWKPDARITFIEYSDLECPFCKKLHSEWTIDQLLESYPDDVNFIFKHFPLGFHEMAAMEAEASECVWELAWSDKYYEFIETVFAASKTDGNSFTKESISDLAWTIWVDSGSVLSCVESGKYTQKVKDQTAEWASFGVTWTPWNVLVDNSTWEFKILPWAYPVTDFKTIIDGFLSN